MSNILTLSALQPIWTELFMALMIMGMLIFGVFKGNRSVRFLSFVAIAGLILITGCLMLIPVSKEPILNGMFVLDTFAINIKIVLAIALIVSYLLSVKYLYDTGFVKFEYPVLIMLAGLGMFLMVSANHLLSFYMALELQSLTLYILAAFNRNAVKSAEAGVKYFILGAISSGLILFGISLIYGFTGVLEYSYLENAITGLEGIEKTAVTFGMMFLIAGVAFKISAVPFHMWTPDVYSGAPLPVTAFFAIVPKLAALVMLLRLLYGPFEALMADWQVVIGFLSVMSMIWAAFAGLVQQNLKRLMAYSSIGNMGYALLGVAVATTEGISATFFYLFLYMIMTAGVFGVLLCMQRDGIVLRKIEDLAGLSRNHPILAYAMAILMFSMSGIPPLSGFFGKMVIFQEVVAQEMYLLAVVGVLTSVIAAYYYLRIIKVMFFDEPDMSYTKEFGPLRSFVILMSVLFAVLFVLRPDAIVPFTRATASDLIGGSAQKVNYVTPKIIDVPKYLEQPIVDDAPLEN